MEGHDLVTTGTKPTLRARLQIFYLGSENGDSNALNKYFKMAKAELVVRCSALNIRTSGALTDFSRQKEAKCTSDMVGSCTAIFISAVSRPVLTIF